jgi:hypothetical protein
LSATAKKRQPFLKLPKLEFFIEIFFEQIKNFKLKTKAISKKVSNFRGVADNFLNTFYTERNIFSRATIKT